MALGQIHFGSSGPELCRADPSKENARGCPFESSGHYATQEEAETAYEAQMGGELPMTLSKPSARTAAPERITLQLDLGEAEVSNGDLTDPKTRFYLANGLCGDLAMAVRDSRGGGDVYFAMDSSASASELEDHAKRGELGALVAHAFVASKHHEGKFVDSYGVKTKDEIEEFFGFDVVKVDPKLLDSYGSAESGKRGAHDLSEFAKSLEQMDKAGKSYSYYEV